MKAIFAIALMVGSVARASEVSSLADSVALLYSKNYQGQMRFRCTATAFKTRDGKARFLTAAHCVTQESELEFKKGTVIPLKDFLYLSDDNEELAKYYRARISWLGSRDDGYDYAVLESSMPAVPARIGTEKTMKLGDSVHNVAVAAGLGKQFYTGTVASLSVRRPLASEESHIEWTGYMLLQLYSAGGSSGSAVANKENDVIAIVVATDHAGMTIAAPISKFCEVSKLCKEN